MSQANEELNKELNALMERLTSEVTTFTSSTAPHNRQSVIQAAQAIVHAAQDSQELYVHFAVNKCEIIVMRLFLKWEAFQKIPLRGSISFADLASKIGADTGLVARLSRMLLATGILSPAGKDRIAHTHRSRAIAKDPLFRSAAKLILFEDFPQPAGTPEYFARYGRHEPTSKEHTPYHFAKNQVDKSIFDMMLSQADLASIFTQAMARTQDYLSTNYDASWLLSKDTASSRRPLLVDVGGGTGQTLRSILSQNPRLDATRCVLQDRHDVIAQFESSSSQRHGTGDVMKGVQTMGIDLHTNQPVKNARAYILRRVLHDYGDEDCVKVLGIIRDAMMDDASTTTSDENEGESKVLIMEMVLESERSPPFCYAMDLAMMGISGKERTREEWEGIVSRAGMKVERVVCGTMGFGVLECVVF